MEMNPVLFHHCPHSGEGNRQRSQWTVSSLDLLCSVQSDHHPQVLIKGVIQAGKHALSLASVLSEMKAVRRRGVVLIRNWTVLELEINDTKPKHGNSCSLLFWAPGYKISPGKVSCMGGNRRWKVTSQSTIDDHDSVKES